MLVYLNTKPTSPMTSIVSANESRFMVTVPKNMPESSKNRSKTFMMQSLVGAWLVVMLFPVTHCSGAVAEASNNELARRLVTLLASESSSLTERLDQIAQKDNRQLQLSGLAKVQADVAKFKKITKKTKAQARLTRNLIKFLLSDVQFLKPLAQKVQPGLETFNSNVTAAFNSTMEMAVDVKAALQQTSNKLASLQVTVVNGAVKVTSLDTLVATHTTQLQNLWQDINSTLVSVNDLEVDVEALGTLVTNNTAEVAQLESQVDINTVSLAALEISLGDTATLVGSLTETASVTASKLQCVQSNGSTSVLFVGCNVHIENGQGITDSTNGLGNLILGYNECGGSCSRTGSHNLVLGQENSYSSYGGIVAGRSNSISGPFATILTGYNNKAEGMFSSITGGAGHTATGYASVARGGFGNKLVGNYTAVSGGQENTANGFSAVVNGGYRVSSDSMYGLKP